MQTHSQGGKYGNLNCSWNTEDALTTYYIGAAQSVSLESDLFWEKNSKDHNGAAHELPAAIILSRFFNEFF